MYRAARRSERGIQGTVRTRKIVSRGLLVQGAIDVQVDVPKLVCFAQGCAAQEAALLTGQIRRLTITAAVAAVRGCALNTDVWFSLRVYPY